MPKIQELGLQAEIAFVRATAIEEFDSTEVIAVYDGLIEPLLSVVMDIQCREDKVDQLIDSVSDFYRSKDSDWAWIISPLSQPEPRVLARHLENRGFILVDKYPGMYLNLQDHTVEAAETSLEIQELEAQDDLSSWIKPLSAAFPPSKDRGEGYRKLLAKLPHGKGTSFRHYLAYHQGEAVCAGTLFLHGELAMIHNIATLPAFQRRGFASAMVCHLLKEAKLAKALHCFLDASLKGKLVYSRLGFEEYCQQLTYKLPKHQE